MPPTGFSVNAAESRRLWRLLADVASGYWAHAADDSTPVLERRGGRRLPKLSDHGQPPARVLRQAVEYLTHNACHLSSPRYFGLMNPRPALVPVLADALASVLNQQLAVEGHAPGATVLEQEALAWFLEPLGWRHGLGQFTSGGSEANLVALKVALQDRLPAVSRKGIRGLRGQPVFYVSEECHHSLEKFADLLGLGRDAVRWVPTDSEFALRPELLTKEIHRDRAAGRLPFCVVATFGTTSSGAVDPIAALARLCRREKLWLHVDAAYGGALILSPRFRRLWGALKQVDSVTFDPHKWLAIPFPLGAVLIRNARAAAAPFRVQAAYVPRGKHHVENYQLGVQWSRRFLGLKLWMAMQVYGRRAYKEHFAQQFRLARLFREELSAQAQLGTVTESPLPITCFTFSEEKRAQHRRIPVASLSRFESQMNLTLAEEMVRRGWAWISSTRLGGATVMRMMVINYATTEDHIRRLVNDLARLVAEPALRRRARRERV